MKSLNAAGLSARPLERGGRAGTDRLRSGEPVVPVPTPAHLLLPRLRYFSDLIVTGYRYAVNPDLFPRSLRDERVALGIELPELDAVPIWSTRRSDSAISVPCLEHILGRIGAGLAKLEACDDATIPVWKVPPGEQRARLNRMVKAAGLPEPREVILPPHMKDLFMPESFFVELCGRDGLLTSIIAMCDSALNARS